MYTIKLNSHNNTFTLKKVQRSIILRQVGRRGVSTSFADFPPSTATSASARFRAGVDPTSPNSGEMWYDGTDLKFRNGDTTQLLAPKSYVEPAITTGTTSQYWRGDKSWQTLNKTAVGLANVDNTSDANKPVSTATQTALDAKQAKVNTWTVITSGMAVPLTGSTSETTLATLTIPAGALGPNGMVRLTMNFSCTNNANSKTCRARLGGMAGTQYLNSPLTSQSRLHVPIMIYNRNSESSQIGGTNAGNQGGYGQSTSGQVTSTVDTTIVQTIVITGQLANASDTLTLESYSLEYHYQA